MRFTLEGKASKYCPYPNITHALLATFIRLAELSTISPSRTCFYSPASGTPNEDGNGLNPADVPESADHFERDARLLTPRLPVVEEEVDDKEGCRTIAVRFSPAALLQRRLESPGAVAGILSNFEGHVLTGEERTANGVVHEHLTPVATRPAGGLRRGSHHGKIAASSALVSLESILVGPSE